MILGFSAADRELQKSGATKSAPITDAPRLRLILSFKLFIFPIICPYSSIR